MSSSGAFRRALLWGALAHVATGVYSFLAKPVTAAFGSIGGGFAVYLITLLGLLGFCLFSSQLRAELLSWHKIAAAAKLKRALLVTLLCYSIGAVCFYQGLISSKNVALYATFVRLDALLLILWGWLILREQVHTINLVGCALAFFGVGALSAWGSMSSAELIWGSVYVGFMTVAGRYTRDLLLQGGYTPKTLLLLRTASVTAFMSLLLPFTDEAHGTAVIGWDLWLYMLSAAAVLGGIFWFRFAALAQLPLWRFWAFSPIHTVVGVAIGLSLGSAISAMGILGVVLIALGEIFAHFKSQAETEH